MEHVIIILDYNAIKCVFVYRNAYSHFPSKTFFTLFIYKIFASDEYLSNYSEFMLCWYYYIIILLFSACFVGIIIPILKSFAQKSPPIVSNELQEHRDKKSIALFNDLLFRMSLKSIDIKISIAHCFE